jgi:hypothetical protein
MRRTVVSYEKPIPATFWSSQPFTAFTISIFQRLREYSGTTGQRLFGFNDLFSADPCVPFKLAALVLDNPVGNSREPLFHGTSYAAS